MTYRELQNALRQHRTDGLTDIKLNRPKAELQAEYDRIQAELTAPKPTATIYSFADLVSRRPRRPQAKGFTPRPEKRYDQLDRAEWIEATFAFLDDDEPMMLAA